MLNITYEEPKDKRITIKDALKNAGFIVSYENITGTLFINASLVEYKTVHSWFGMHESTEVIELFSCSLWQDANSRWHISMKDNDPLLDAITDALSTVDSEIEIEMYISTSD